MIPDHILQWLPIWSEPETVLLSLSQVCVTIPYMLGFFLCIHLFASSATSLPIYLHAAPHKWPEFLTPSTFLNSLSWKHFVTHKSSQHSSSKKHLSRAHLQDVLHFRGTRGSPGKIQKASNRAVCLTGNSAPGASLSAPTIKSTQVLSHLWMRSSGSAASSRRDKMWLQKFLKGF